MSSDPPIDNGPASVEEMAAILQEQQATIERLTLHCGYWKRIARQLTSELEQLAECRRLLREAVEMCRSDDDHTEWYESLLAHEWLDAARRREGTMSDTCECGGRIVPAFKQITEHGDRYPLRDRETGEQLRACVVCGMVVRRQKAGGDDE